MIPVSECEAFITVKAFECLDGLQESDKALWGLMNARQMTEHLEDLFRLSTGAIATRLITPEDQVPKYQAFLYTDKSFRPNTPGPEEMVPAIPPAPRYESLDLAKKHLKESCHDFMAFFQKNPDAKTLHPVFGQLDFEGWLRLHEKHMSHHLRQFGLIS